jgi:hypothetical protein
MLFCKDNESIFHVHIPRTGGRYIRELFVYNHFKIYHSNYERFVEGIELPHLHYPLYNYLEGAEESKQFTIVRNPFNKFKSTMNLIIKGREYPIEVYDMLKDKDWLFNFIDYEKTQSDLYKSNTFRPQKEFISEKTKVYKFENGLGENLIEWLNENIDLKLRNASVFYQKGPLELKKYKFEQEIDPKVEDLIKEYYAEDYEFFNY